MATDFSSLDKLVEFGMGIGIATQMMNTMNHVIANTSVPGVGINPGITPNPIPCNYKPQNVAMMPFYIVKDDRVAGPLSTSEVSLLVDKDVITLDTLCWRYGMNAWKFAKDIPEINKLLLLKS